MQTKHFSVYSILLGTSTLIAMGFTAFKQTSINGTLTTKSNWAMINFEKGIALAFSSLFALIMVIASFVFVVIGTTQITMKCTENKELKSFCERFNKKFKIDLWDKWFILGFAVTSILQTICLGIYISSLNSATQISSIGWSSFLIVFISLVVSTVCVINPFIDNKRFSDSTTELTKKQY